jgi:probable HAF family extracellular repeat protein
VGVLLGIWLAFPAAGQAPEYDVTDLGTLGGESANALGINNAGQVVGEAELPSGLRRPYIWQAGLMLDLGTIGDGRIGSAWTINEQGQAVGFSESEAFGDWHACLWAGAEPQDLGTLGGAESEAYGIDEQTRIVGRSNPAMSLSDHGFVWQGGTMTDLGTLGGTNSLAFAINESGKIVGRSFTDSAERAFLWEAGEMTDLGTLGGDHSQAWDLNDSDQVVGRAQTAALVGHAFLWQAGTMNDLAETADPRSSTATAINELGHVVGDVADVTTQFAFLWRDGTMHDLNTLIPAGSDWTLLRANDINDRGQIVGYGFREGFGGFRAFLLTSCAPPPVTGVLAERLPNGDIRFTWDPLAEAERYDLIGDALPISDFEIAPCRTAEDNNPSDTSFRDRAVPPVGTAEWLLVRGVDEGCGVAGTYDTRAWEGRSNSVCP